MNINWFPGHMAKTRKLLQENLKLVDIVIELLDARIPLSSRNPEIDQIVGSKPRIVLLGKSDLADEKANAEWVKWYKKSGIDCILVDVLKGKGLQELKTRARQLLNDKLEAQKAKGRLGRPIRMMVAGIPNVGKSSLINKLSGKASAITGDRPGVTKGKQWIRLNQEMELLDTPGILWPKFEDPVVGLKLAFTGAIKDEILDVVELSEKLIMVLVKKYPRNIAERYKLDMPIELISKDQISEDESRVLLETIARKRGCILSGGVIDYERASVMLLDELRAGKMGRITLELPDEGNWITIRPSVREENENNEFA